MIDVYNYCMISKHTLQPAQKLPIGISTGSALQQITERGYADKYRDGRELYQVGIEFSREQRNIVGFEWVRVE